MTKNKGRVVGLDVHPDSFAGAVVEGSDPAQARVLSSSTRVELEQLEQWALRHTSTGDRLVLEASGNAFAVAARLRTIGRKVEILDSHRAGKVGKVYCANDRVDAVKIARIYLSAPHGAAPTHGPGDRGRGSAAAIDPALWDQSGYSLRSGGGGGRCVSLQSQQKVGRIPWTQPECIAERQLSRQRSTQAAWKRSAASVAYP